MFIFVDVDFTLTNGADPDGIKHVAAFHLGFHCLPNQSLIAGQISEKTCTYENNYET